MNTVEFEISGKIQLQPQQPIQIIYAYKSAIPMLKIKEILLHDQQPVAH